MALMGKTVLLFSRVVGHNLFFTDSKDAELHGLLQFSGGEVTSPYARFVVEKAKTEGLVHVRCCHNNKYWMRRSPDEDWIVALGNEPEEDQSKWSCTLFEAINTHEDGGINDHMFRFRHTQLGRYACLWLPDMDEFRDHTNCLYAGSATPDPDDRDAYKVIDWETLVIFPKHVAFKGDNGCYLSAYTNGGHPYLQFSSKDIGDSTVGDQVIINGDGTIRIKSNYYGKLWTSDNWIWAYTYDDGPLGPDTLFWPVKIDKNVVALRSLGTNKFCKRLTADNIENCLNAIGEGITKEARLEVEELVLSRDVYNVHFRTNDAKVVTEEVSMRVSEIVENATEQSSTVEIKMTYTDSKTKTWNSSVSLTLGVKTTFKTGIPFVVEGKVEVSAEVKGEYQWGESDTTSSEAESSYTVVVPPMSKVKVTLLATKGLCDVPFSYYQRDLLMNGEYVTHKKDDGFFSGVNYYNFYAKSIPIVD